MMNRRKFTKQISLLVPSLGAALLPHSALAKNVTNTKTKRVIFFLQNQGFDPKTCLENLPKQSCSLNSLKLAKPMHALEPYKNKMNIIMGLHGKHTSPFHSAYFGALGGYRGGVGIPPVAQTVDNAISQILPETILPHLCIGMDSMESMKAKPTIASLSASGPGKPLYMHSDPNKLYQLLFGCIAKGDILKRYLASSKILTHVEKLSAYRGKNLPEWERARYSGFVNGFTDLNELRSKLIKISNKLRLFAPKYDQRFHSPKFETDWHDSLLDIGIAALQANITNVLTIGSGRGEIFGSWRGLGVSERGHSLGHMKQPGSDVWDKIRGYNSAMLVKIIKSLESTPENGGTMMDNTLIVYTSNNADKQHTTGSQWPFVLIGNGGGAFKTNRFTQINNRPLNDLYTTILRGIGKPIDSFNMSSTLASITNSKIGPIEELLA